MARSPNNYAILDMSGGVQNATSHLLRKRNEVYNATNATFHKVIGAAKRRDGYEIVGNRVSSTGNDSLYGGVYVYGGNNKLLAGVNDSGNQFARLRYLDSDTFWKDIITNASPNTRFQCLNFLDELYVGGKSPSAYMPLTNIDSTLTPSTSRNVYGAPACKYIAQFAGSLYAINCQVNGVTYSDRVYKSSNPMGAVTFVQTSQNGLLNGLHVDSVQYLKVGMSLDIYGAGTNNLKVQGLTIVSVDKANQRVGFSATNINVNDNDEVWLSGRHGLLTTFWNTDYPTPQSADWFRIPPGEDETADITGWKVNNNRLFLFTKNSTWKWDGANLIELSPVIGCVSHETIQCISSWVIWLHSTGVWGYNDNTGQTKFLSRAVTPDILLINPVNYKYCSAVVSNRIYKLSAGQLQDATVATTSTSTSSTSTSSTSTSTSSTSTSSTSISTTTATATTLTTTTSTSTSSTSLSTSTSSTSTSSTSTSVSSTSSSISSTSISSTSSSLSTSSSTSTSMTISFTTSTSSTSTSTSFSSTSTSISTSSTSTSSTSMSTTVSSTTTQPTNKNCVRFCYDFDLNIWWKELHTREQRFQFIHEMNGLRKPYFTDENGYLFRDETSFNDSGNSIPMIIEIGRTNCGADQDKAFLSAQVNSENARGGIIEYSLDGGDFQTLGQIKDNIQDLTFPQAQQLVQARDIDFRFVHNDLGDPPVFNGMTLYFNITESIVNELGQRL